MHDDLVDVYDAGSLIEGTLLRDRLEGEGIQAFLDNTDSPPRRPDRGVSRPSPSASCPTMPDRARPIVDAFVAEAQ